MAKQVTQQKERVLVHEDLSGLSVVVDSISKVISLANEVAVKYEDLALGQFTKEVYSDISENNLLNIRIQYLANIRAEIKRLKVTNPSMQHAMLGDIDRALEPLKNAIAELKKYSRNRVGYSNLLERYKKASFNAGRFILTEEDLEKLKDEFCRIFIEDEKQKVALDSLRNFVESYNNLLNSVSEMNPSISSDMIQNPLKVWDYITFENQKVAVYNPNLSYFLITQ